MKEKWSALFINWKSNYKLPISFILFFVLFFFIVGEQLPALPTYLIGPGLGGDGPNKLHILDLNPTDSLHRPFAYLIIGTVIWFLFKTFAWSIAWFIGAVFWALEQSFLTPLDQRPSIQNIIFFTFTFWIILTLVPYFIYRWVDKKWGGQGKRNAILITLAVNLLLFGFFAYQIFYLHNSYRSSGDRPGLPASTCPERLITEKDQQTTAYWQGKILPVSGEVQNWVEKNCPGVIERLKSYD